MEVGDGGCDVRQLGGADQEAQAAGGRNQVCGYGENCAEALYGSEGDYVGGRMRGDQGFGAGGDYIDVGQCKGADYFAEEGGLFVVRFD